MRAVDDIELWVYFYLFIYYCCRSVFFFSAHDDDDIKHKTQTKRNKTVVCRRDRRRLLLHAARVLHYGHSYSARVTPPPPQTPKKNANKWSSRGFIGWWRRRGVYYIMLYSMWQFCKNEPRKKHNDWSQTDFCPRPTTTLRHHAPCSGAQNVACPASTPPPNLRTAMYSVLCLVEQFNA